MAGGLKEHEPPRHGADLHRSRDDLLEDEGTERAEEAETEPKQRVGQLEARSSFPGIWKMGSVSADTQRGQEFLSVPARQPGRSVPWLHMPGLSNSSSFPARLLSPRQPIPPLLLPPQTAQSN